MPVIQQVTQSVQPYKLLKQNQALSLHQVPSSCCVAATKKYLFSDCAININPDAEGLAEIAVESAKTAAMFDIDPKVALLSFSTKGSAKSPEQEKVAEATRLAKEKHHNLKLTVNYNLMRLL